MKLAAYGVMVCLAGSAAAVGLACQAGAAPESRVGMPASLATQVVEVSAAAMRLWDGQSFKSVAVNEYIGDWQLIKLSTKSASLRNRSNRKVVEVPFDPIAGAPYAWPRDFTQASVTLEAHLSKIEAEIDLLTQSVAGTSEMSREKQRQLAPGLLRPKQKARLQELVEQEAVVMRQRVGLASLIRGDFNSARYLSGLPVVGPDTRNRQEFESNRAMNGYRVDRNDTNLFLKCSAAEVVSPNFRCNAPSI